MTVAPSPTRTQEGGAQLPRPKALTREMLAAAADATAIDMFKRGIIGDEERASHAADIAAVGDRHMDGYELARALESRCSWHCDFEIAESLDGFGDYCCAELERAERAWFEAVSPEAPLPIGTLVSCPRGETGTITGIYEYGPAKYLIAIDGDATCGPGSSGRLVVNFEDVRALEGQSQDGSPPQKENP